MKWNKDKLELLKNNLETVIDNCKFSLSEIVERYETGKFHNSQLTENLQMRFCFDLFYAIPQVNRELLNIYENNGNDDHLFTALKNCLPTIERQY
jgi:hypothetical protein